MAAGSLGKPGSKYGPCKKRCEHRDCALSRLQAAAVCRLCKRPIGYDRSFFVEGSPLTLLHESCAQDEADQVLAARRDVVGQAKGGG
jgi:hypothetical protein